MRRKTRRWRREIKTEITERRRRDPEDLGSILYISAKRKREIEKALVQK
jgi:hypothetical protein